MNSIWLQLGTYSRLCGEDFRSRCFRADRRHSEVRRTLWTIYGLPTVCQVLRTLQTKQLRSELKQVDSRSLGGVSWIVSWRCVVVRTAVLPPTRLIRLAALEHGNQDSEEAVGNTAESASVLVACLS